MGKKKETYVQPLKPLPTWARWTNLAIGDILALVLFAFVGRGSHGEDNGPVEVALTALPFLIGWFVMAPLLGAYRAKLEMEPGKMARVTILAWIPAWVIAHVIRSILNRSISHWSFLLVSLLFGGFFLLIWRVPLAIVRKSRSK